LGAPLKAAAKVAQRSKPLVDRVSDSSPPPSCPPTKTLRISLATLTPLFHHRLRHGRHPIGQQLDFLGGFRVADFHMELCRSCSLGMK